MDRSALHELDLWAELLETRRDLVGRLVGEREDADSIRVDSKVLDQKSNALDEAERLARPRSGEDKDRPQGSLDRLALRFCRDARRIWRYRRVNDDDSVRSGKAGDRCCQELVVR
jgi:hypothetical protein